MSTIENALRQRYTLFLLNTCIVIKKENHIYGAQLFQIFGADNSTCMDF
jgi:hypothetical protein